MGVVGVARWPSPGGCPLPPAHGFWWPCLGSPSPALLAGAALQRAATLSWTAEGQCLIPGGLSQDSRLSGRWTGTDEGPGRVSTATWGCGAQGAHQPTPLGSVVAVGVTKLPGPDGTSDHSSRPLLAFDLLQLPGTGGQEWDGGCQAIPPRKTFKGPQPVSRTRHPQSCSKAPLALPGQQKHHAPCLRDACSCPAEAPAVAAAPAPAGSGRHPVGTRGCVLSPDLAFSAPCSHVSQKRPKLPPALSCALKSPGGDSAITIGLCSWGHIRSLEPLGLTETPRQLPGSWPPVEPGLFVTVPWPQRAGGKMAGQGAGPRRGPRLDTATTSGVSPPGTRELGLPLTLACPGVLVGGVPRACSPPRPQRTSPQLG